MGWYFAMVLRELEAIAAWELITRLSFEGDRTLLY